METQANESNEKTLESTLTVVEPSKPKTHEEELEHLIDAFGSLKALREDITMWFSFYMGTKDVSVAFTRHDYPDMIWRYHQLLEYLH